MKSITFRPTEGSLKALAFLIEYSGNNRSKVINEALEMAVGARAIFAGIKGEVRPNPPPAGRQRVDPAKIDAFQRMMAQGIKGSRK